MVIGVSKRPYKLEEGGNVMQNDCTGCGAALEKKYVTDASTGHYKCTCGKEDFIKKFKITASQNTVADDASHFTVGKKQTNWKKIGAIASIVSISITVVIFLFNIFISSLVPNPNDHNGNGNSGENPGINNEGDGNINIFGDGNTVIFPNPFDATNNSPHIETSPDAHSEQPSAVPAKTRSTGFTEGLGSWEYYGYVSNGKPHGEGKLTWENGDSYDGDWIHGVMTGSGTRTGTNQEGLSWKYVGEFLNGKQHGTGKIDWENKDWYDGSWVNGYRHGEDGIYYCASTETYKRGRWENDTFAD